ncbi:MAG: HNH endonuclease [Gemmatimonadales bacterium]|nr:MAG: HNH endonuclease [Gemmatimonadales bacterium]
MVKRLPVLVRLMRRIEIQEDGCWVWIGSRTRTGYGMMNYGGKGHNRLTHRVSYEIFKGEIPEDLELDHLCRTRACANPDHLEAVTPKVNRDRGQSIPAINAQKTHCKSGHLLSGENLYIIPSTGSRVCLICKKSLAKRAYLRDRDRILQNLKANYIPKAERIDRPA